MIRVQVFNAHPQQTINRTTITKLARAVFKSENTPNALCNLVFVDDKRMIDLNGTYLNHWYATDVLAFPLHEDPQRCREGEVYVNVDQARRQAPEYGVTITAELARLAIHGVLHLIGYRDGTKREKERMSRLENKYLLLLN